MSWHMKKYKKSRKSGGKRKRHPRMALYFFDQTGSRLGDPEDEEGFPELEDPEDEEGFPELEDPEDEEGFPELEDPEDEEGFPELEDPEDEEGFPELEDPASYRRARRRLKKVAALWGDFPSGRPGNVRRGIKNQHSGSLVIRLAPRYAYLPYDRLENLAGDKLAGLAQVLTDYKLPSSPRVVRKLEEESWSEPVQEAETQSSGGEQSPKTKEQTSCVEGPFRQLRDLEQKAAENGLAPLHSLAAYWRVDADHLPREETKELLWRLNRLPEVDRAYRELAASDPGYGTDSFLGSQGYLNPAPVGIDVRWAERTAGGPSLLGARIKLVDLEQGWITGHPDLKAKQLGDPLYGDNRHEDPDNDYQGNHGTAVLGEIAAASDGSGVVGIAPGASLSLASHYDKTTQTNGHVADAIYAAAQSLDQGDVLLIEVQRSYLPAEVDDADFDAIRLASGSGIVVVEAAGNGGRNLDAYRRRKKGARIFNRRGGGYRESGAIMVGAALSTLPHNRKRSSNYGSRIDCYAWGNRVVTCGFGDLYTGNDVNDTYTADFTNTSAAAPMIAGAALVLQGMYLEAAGNGRLSPGQMRALLADPATGTRQGRGVRGHIGVMPNLRAIVKNSLRIVPDVYLRDHAEDTGDVPVKRRVCCSPDILVTQKRGANFGEGSGTEGSLTAGYKALTNRANYVFVRMRNRGRRNAAKVAATVYWSEAATLVTPDRWREIGCATASVAQGDTLKVAGPIRWPGGSVPPHGYYCLAALLENTEDPAPPPPGLLVAEGAWKRHFGRKRRSGRIAPPPPDFDWYAFLAYLRTHNNIAWRNFHVVDGIPYKRNQKAKLDFLITGTPAGDRGRFFDLEILQRLPEGAKLWLDVPMPLAPALSVGGPWKPKVEEGDNKEMKDRMLRFHLPPLPRVPFFGVPLAAGAEHACHFTVHGAKGMEPGGHSVAIRQLFRGQEVGRVTWQFHKQC